MTEPDGPDDRTADPPRPRASTSGQLVGIDLDRRHREGPLRRTRAREARPAGLRVGAVATCDGVEAQLGALEVPRAARCSASRCRRPRLGRAASAASARSLAVWARATSISVDAFSATPASTVAQCRLRRSSPGPTWKKPPCTAKAISPSSVVDAHDARARRRPRSPCAGAGP